MVSQVGKSSQCYTSGTVNASPQLKSELKYLVPFGGCISSLGWLAVGMFNSSVKLDRHVREASQYYRSFMHCAKLEMFGVQVRLSTR